MLTNFVVSRGTFSVWCLEGCMLLFFPSNRQSIHFQTHFLVDFASTLPPVNQEHFCWCTWIHTSVKKSGPVYFDVTLKGKSWPHRSQWQKSQCHRYQRSQPGFPPRFCLPYVSALYAVANVSVHFTICCCCCVKCRIAVPYTLLLNLLKKHFRVSARSFLCLIYIDIHVLRLVMQWERSSGSPLGFLPAIWEWFEKLGLEGEWGKKGFCFSFESIFQNVMRHSISFQLAIH